MRAKHRSKPNESPTAEDFKRNRDRLRYLNAAAGAKQDSEADRDTLAQRVKELEAELERYRHRDGKASITLSLPSDTAPWGFARYECPVVDFGYADNGYVVECDELAAALAKHKEEG
jgi:hypothetical protein